MPFLESLTENQIKNMIKRDFEGAKLQADESLQKIEITLKSIDTELKKIGS